MFSNKNIINRNLYLQRLIPFIGKSIIKVFTGQRRVGKSFLLYQIMNYIKEKDNTANIIYVNKEDLRFSHIKNSNDLNEYIQQHIKPKLLNYIFIDEIQDIDDFAIALRSLLLKDNIDIYCTGSNANLLSADIAGYLSGRYIEINIYSLTYTEFLNFHKLENNDDSLDKYLKYGGLPYLIHLPLIDDIVFEYLSNIYSTIIYKDVVNRYSIRNVTFLEQLVKFLADNTGSIFSAKKISDFLLSQGIKVAANQVQKYIQYLSNAFLINKVSRFDLVGKRIFEFGEKFYFENLGIRHGIWGYRLEDKAKILENVVFNHLITQNYKVNVGNIGPYEIDFVTEKNGETEYYQVTLHIHDSKTMEREMGNLKKIKNNYKKTVITMDKYTGVSHEGIRIVDLRSFLSDD